MLELFLLPEARPFAVAAAILIGLTAIELVTLLAGVSLSHLVEKSFDDHGWFDQHFGWLNVGRVPLLVLIILVLAGFSGSGFLLRAVAGTIGIGLPAWIGAGLAAAATIPFVRVASRLVANLIPRDETYAVELDDLVGLMAEVTVGPLDAGLPGRVRLKDRHGNWHILRARAALGEDPMAVGAPVILIERRSDTFVAMPAPEIVAPPHSAF